MSLKPAPASLRDLPRAPPGALPPAPGGYGGGLPPAPGRGGYAPPPGGGYGGGAPRPTTQLPPRGGTGGGGGPQHPTGLPPNLLALFEPRPPLEYMPPPARPRRGSSARCAGSSRATTARGAACGSAAGSATPCTPRRAVSSSRRDRRVMRQLKDCQTVQSNFFGKFINTTKNEKCRRGPFSRHRRTEKRRPPREARAPRAALPAGPAAGGVHEVG